MLSNENSFFELSYKGYLKTYDFIKFILETEKKNYSEKDISEYDDLNSKLRGYIKNFSKYINTFSLNLESYVGKKNNAINNIIEVCYNEEYDENKTVNTIIENNNATNTQNNSNTTNTSNNSSNPNIVKTDQSFIDKFNVDTESFTDNSISPIDYINYIKQNSIFIKYISKEKFFTDDDFLFKQKIEFCKTDKYVGNLLINLGFEKKQDVKISQCRFFEVLDSDILIKIFYFDNDKRGKIIHFEIFSFCPESDSIRLEYLTKKMKEIKNLILKRNYIEFVKS